MSGVQSTRLVEIQDLDDGVRVVTVHGAVDVFRAGRLHRDAVAGLGGSTREMVLDLTAVSRVDSGGVSAIVKLVREMRAQSVPMRASIGATSSLSASMLELLRQVLPCDDETVVPS